MDDRQLHQVSMGVGVCLALVSIFLPSVMPTVPHYVAWIGLAVAAMFFLWGVWPFFRPRKETPAHQPPLSPSLVSGNNNAISMGQSGGVTASTYINQAVPPEFKISSQREADNPDGTHTVHITAVVDAPFVPGLLTLMVQAEGLLGVELTSTPDASGFASTMLRNVRLGPSFYAAEVPSPRGSYEIAIRTQSRAPIQFDAKF